ncbi:MAG: hypothetical protein Q8R18_01335 [bacterium]|nr:hypothetical protein [bacterium]
MKRKGQFTLFVIFGIFLAVLIGLWVFFTYFAEETKNPISEAMCIQDSQEILQQCVKDTFVEFLETSLLQGGYLELEEESSFGTAYAYKGELLLPNTKEIEEELEQNIERKLRNCGEDINQFAYIDQKDLNTNISLDNSADIQVNWDATVVCGMSSVNGYMIPFDTDFDFESFYSLVEEIFAEGDRSPTEIQEGYILQQYYNEDLSESMKEIQENTTSYKFTFRSTVEEVI